MPNDNIFQQYLTPPKSVMDYTAEMDQADARKNALQMSALGVQDAQMKLASAAEVNNQRNALRAAVTAGQIDLSNPGHVSRALAIAPDVAPGLLKTVQDSATARALAAKDTAAAGESTQKTTAGEYDLRIKKSDQAIKDIAGFTTPQDALASLDAHVAAGDVAPDKAQLIRQGMPQDPAKFSDWKVGMIRNIMSAKEQMQYVAPDANTVATNQQSNKNSQRTAATAAASQTAENARAEASRKTQLQVAGVDPNGGASPDVESMAQGIAAGKLAPINGFALARPRGQTIMARVMEINPNYDAGDYAAKAAALKAFSTGKEGAALRSFNVATDHLSTLGEMTTALQNGNNQFFNQAANFYAEKTGSAAPTNFDAVKEIVGKEVVKAIVAGGGGVAEREELSKLLSSAKSPEQLRGVIGHFTELMTAQRAGLMDQYQRTTGRTDGDVVFAPSKPSVKPAGATPAGAAGAKPSLSDIFGH